MPARCRGLLLAIGLCLWAASTGIWAQSAPSSVGATAPGSHSGSTGWRVLVLTLVDPELPASVVHSRSFKDALEALAPQPVTFFSESFDAPNFDPKRMEPEMVALFRKKYANQPIDLVVAVSADVAEFVEKYHDTLWPGAGVMFTAVHQRSIKPGNAVQKYPYVAWKSDVAGTLEVLQGLQPDAKRLVVIAGTTYFDEVVLQDVKEALVGNTRWNTEYWTTYSQAQLRERLALLPKDSAVLYTTLFKDAAGLAAYPRNALENIAIQSSVPVYGMFSSYIGRRMTAGSLLDFQDLGRDAAGLAVQILQHKIGPLQTMQIFATAHCFADAKRVDSFGLALKDLPKNCDIQNPLRNLWTDYQGLVIAAALVIGLQALTIAGMRWQMHRRQAAEQQSDVHRLELQRAMRFAAMGELTASIAHEINQPLGAILSNAQAAEMLLNNGTATVEDLKAILIDIQRDDQRAHTVVSRLRTLLGKIETQQVPVHLHACIQDVMTLLTPEAKRRGVTIALSLRADRDLLKGDPVQFQQMLLNLVLNAMDALDHTERHLRRIQIQTVSADDHLALTVADNGPGMDETTQERIFDSLFTTKKNSLGMGLSIVRAIVDAHHGTIRVQSRNGQGTVFTVHIPTMKDTPC